MPTTVFLGEFEQLVLLSVLSLGGDPSALEVRGRLEEVAGRAVSRGALYRTFDRLEKKGWISWTVDEEDVPERGGLPRRRFRVSPAGVEALAASRAALLELWAGVDGALG